MFLPRHRYLLPKHLQTKTNIKDQCLPMDRVWPAKCELCIKKGFPCSESKRLFRSTKHALTPILSPTNVASTSATSVAFEECLKQW